MTYDRSHNKSLEQMDRDTFFHPATHLKDFASGALGDPRIIKDARGIHIYDQNGNDLIDGFAGLYCVNIGYGRPEIAEAIYTQAKEMAYFHTYAGFSNEPAIRLSQRIINMAPENMSKVFYGLSGSDANETLIKIVWYYNNVLERPKKKKIISRGLAYHGSLIMSGSLTGVQAFHNHFDLPIEPVLHTTTPHHYRYGESGMTSREFAKKCANDLNALIEAEGAETIAAFIGEPILGSGGIIPPPEGYWQEIQTVLTQHDVLLIADEIVCGFGRMGTNFGSDYYEIKPDLISIGKGLTSAYIPLSGAIVGDKVWQVLEQGSDKFGPFPHVSTYSAHPVGAAAALATLDILESENITANAGKMASYLQRRLHETFDDHPLVGEVRGEGLLAAIEFVEDKANKKSFSDAPALGRKIAAACLEEGLIARAMPHGDVLGFSPPLIITSDEIDDMIERTLKAINRITETL